MQRILPRTETSRLPGSAPEADDVHLRRRREQALQHLEQRITLGLNELDLHMGARQQLADLLRLALHIEGSLLQQALNRPQHATHTSRCPSPRLPRTRQFPQQLLQRRTRKLVREEVRRDVL